MRIKSVKYLDNYRLWILFNDGKRRIANFSGFLEKAGNPMTTKYRNKKLFSKVELRHGTLSWNNGEMEFDPIDIYNGEFSNRKSLI